MILLEAGEEIKKMGMERSLMDAKLWLGRIGKPGVLLHNRVAIDNIMYYVFLQFKKITIGFEIFST